MEGNSIRANDDNATSFVISFRLPFGDGFCVWQLVVIKGPIVDGDMSLQDLNSFINGS